MLNGKVNTLLSRFNLKRNSKEPEPEGWIQGPVFIGTRKEFRRYVGPVLRNLVQQLTRKHRAKMGTCQHCGAGENLQSAHVAGRSRNHIINDLLKEYVTRDVFQVNLKEFEEKFKTEHEPLEKSILILCKSCHLEYDSKPIKAYEPSPSPSLKPKAEPVKGNPVLSRRIKQVIITSDDFSSFKRFKIGKLVRQTLPMLLTTGRIGNSELIKLQDAVHSKTVYDVNYPVLKEVEESMSLTDNREVNGYPRYYAHPYKYNNRRYLITSEWFDRNHEYYLNWLQKYVQD